MSELYLVLRSRLDQVTEWVTVGQKRMRAARTAKGLSYESMSRKIPVSSKTWERWEKRGQVPIYHLARVAEVLELEIERSHTEGEPIKVDADAFGEAVAQFAAAAAALSEVAGDLRQFLQAERTARQEPAARR